ncbi:MAG: TonB-dependent receptor [Proteobacteria bacterium]|nr:TonB-dependent receptor [Pseudomonadota bacterium]
MGIEPADPGRLGGKAARAALAVSVLFASTSLVAAPADGNDGKEGKWIEEVIVTAEKRDENILKVPLSMSAFSERMIEELGMTNDQDLEQLVPGLQFGYDSEGSGISMRGIGTQKAAQYNADLAVAFYLDGVYTYAVDTFGISPNMFDMERVEVARGPQGTLNGRNSIAGAVNLVSKKPTDTWDVNVLTEFTDQFSQRYNVALGGPLNDDFSFRISGGYHEGDGAQENVGIGDDYDAPDLTTIAPSLRFKRDGIDITARYQNARDKGSNRAFVTFVEVPRDTPTVGQWGTTNVFYLYDKPIPSVEKCPSGQYSEFGGICGDLENKVLSNRSSINDSESDRWTVNADFDVSETLVLRYTYGTSKTDTFGSRDGDGTDRVGSAEDPTVPKDCVDRLGLAACAGVTFSDTATAYINANDESSHELQLVSNLDGPFNFIVGVYTYENDTAWTQTSADYGSVLSYTNAETAATSIDRDNDGTPDYSSCQDFYQSYVLGERGLDPNLYRGCEPGDTHLFAGGSSSGAKSDTTAVFGNLEYRINDTWQVAGGLRWTEDKKAQSGINGFSTLSNQLGVPIRYTSSLSNRKHSWDATIGHISVEYSPVDGQMYYGRISTGYRAGGFNQISGGTSAEDIANNIVPANFDEETLTNYEIGVKGKYLDGRVVVMAAAYFQDFDDFHFNAQQYVSDSFLGKVENPFLEYTDNVQGTEIWGAELEGTYYIGDRWRLSGFYNYLDSSIGNHQSFFWGDRDGCVSGLSFACPPGTVLLDYSYIDDATGETISTQIAPPRDNTGNRLPQQPKHKGALTLAYSQPMWDGTASYLTTWSYTGARFPSIGNIGYQKIDSYSRWDIRASWTSGDEVWSATVYVQNVLDEIGITEFVDCCSGGWLSEPRQVGLQVRWRPDL